MRAPAGLSEALCRVWGIPRQQDWPIAALSAPLPREGKNAGYWLRLDPVHLEIGLRGMFVRGGQALDDDDGETLLTLLTPLFAAHGLDLHVSPAGSLHVRLPTCPDLLTTPLDLAEDHQATHSLPKGGDAPFWLRLLNEAQMALHEHPLNASRVMRGLPPVNGLWAWGGGLQPQIEVPHGRVWADMPWIRQCAAGMGFAVEPAPSTFAQLPAPLGHEMVVLDTGWLGGECAANLEANWFAPLWHALRRGHLRQVHLTLLTEVPACVSINRFQAWRFW